MGTVTVEIEFIDGPLHRKRALTKFIPQYGYVFVDARDRRLLTYERVLNVGPLGEPSADDDFSRDETVFLYNHEMSVLFTKMQGDAPYANPWKYPMTLID